MELYKLQLIQNSKISGQLQNRTRLYVHVVPGVNPAGPLLSSRVSERIDAVKSIYAAGTRFPGVDLRVFRPCFTVRILVRMRILYVQSKAVGFDVRKGGERETTTSN